MSEAAMFPLGSVLFPYMPLALRVFEERYLVMLARVLDTPEREFGVVLIERGQEVGGGDKRFAIGTMARVAKVTAGDDQINLIAQGGRRVEVMHWLEEDPHPRAIIRDLPDLIWDDDLGGLRDNVERAVRRVLARLAEFAEIQWDPDIGLSDDPVASAWQLAAIAPLGPLDQVALLSATSARQLLTDLYEYTLAAEPLLTSPNADDDLDAEMGRLLDQPQEAAPDPGSATSKEADAGADGAEDRQDAPADDDEAEGPDASGRG